MPGYVHVSCRCGAGFPARQSVKTFENCYSALRCNSRESRIKAASVGRLLICPSVLETWPLLMPGHTASRASSRSGLVTMGKDRPARAIAEIGILFREVQAGSPACESVRFPGNCHDNNLSFRYKVAASAPLSRRARSRLRLAWTERDTG